MKTTSVEFNQNLYSFKDCLHSFAMSFTKDADDADDLVQDTLFKAINFSSKFQEGTNMKGWLFMILRNTFINNYRRKNKTNSLISVTDEISSDQLKYSASYNRGENTCTMDDINKAMEKLQPAYLVPFTRYFEGYKYHEIAEELDIPIGTVKTRIHAARIILKKNLKMYKEQFDRAS